MRTELAVRMFTISRTHHDYENRISREDVYCIKNADFFVRTELAVRMFSISRTHDDYENRISREGGGKMGEGSREKMIGY